jgi:EAL domain-containing protein (putative c-di-GMP-specific phosphodiesterase class I)
VNENLVEAYTNLTKQATTDAGTGLPNIQGMPVFLTQFNHDAHNMALLVIRIENSDNVINTAGPEVIDTFFKLFADRLGGIFAKSASIFRSGDLEFSVCLQNITILASAEQTSALQKALTRKIDLSLMDVYPQVSLGIDVGTVNAANVIDRLINARLAAALYDSSKSVIPKYESKIRSRIDEQHAMVERIRAGLAQREFIPFYQIKVDAHSGEPCGMEALCRWQQSDGSFEMPYRFIPVAENGGLIADMTWQMLEQILLDYQRWLKLGLNPGRIAFNAAEGFLMEAGCAEKLATMISALKSNTCPLDLEITENVAMSGNKRLIDNTLHAIRDLGMPIALDDFGTGFASLSSVISMDIDIIKVDQSFVRKMSECKDSHNVVVTILNLCRLLEKKSVVEGVETENEWSICRDLGCDEVQGYHFYKPASFDDVTKVLSSINPHQNAV